MTTTDRVEERAKRDGCGCPAWVVRCAGHGLGWLLVICDNTAEVVPCGSARLSLSHFYGYRVGLLSGNWGPCPECGTTTAADQQLQWSTSPGLSRAEAEAEFYRREADLLGRES